jgi:hypothetical protein
VERLSEKRTSFDPTEEYLADLIRASEPVVVTPARKQRVLNRVLLRQHTRRAATSVLLRPVFVIGVLSLAGATAAATIGRRAWSERNIRSMSAVQPELSAPVAPSRRARLAHTAPVEEAAPVVAPAPSAPVPVAKHVARPISRAKIGAKIGARTGTRIASSEDPSRVVDAIQALRNGHDPVRAGRLLSEYLARYPHGALAEEAVALSIEAAAARHSPSAATFAQRYLREYPHGRFRHTAEQALEQSPN